MIFKIDLSRHLMILCHCAAVTDVTIVRMIAEGATTVREITRRCGAGRCVPCRDEVCSLLYAASAATDTRPSRAIPAEARSDG
jgi:bacterioferritin-associated ferredoxin